MLFEVEDVRLAGKSSFVDINGNKAFNYTDYNGKQHGRSRAEYQLFTHFDNADFRKGV